MILSEEPAFRNKKLQTIQINPHQSNIHKPAANKMCENIKRFLSTDLVGIFYGFRILHISHIENAHNMPFKIINSIL